MAETPEKCPADLHGPNCPHDCMILPGDPEHDAPPQPARPEIDFALAAGASVCLPCNLFFPSKKSRCPECDKPTEVQPAPAGFEEAHVFRCLCRMVYDDGGKATLQVGSADARCIALRIAHAEEVERTRAAAYGATDKEDLRWAASVVDDLIAKARAAGVEQGRREMATEALEEWGRLRPFPPSNTSVIGIFIDWLATRAGEEKRG